MPNTQKKKAKNNILKLYLDRLKNFDPCINSAPSANLRYCVVIPCFNEPDIINTLNSLYNNHPVEYDTEIIVNVNAPEDASNTAINQNLKTIAQLEKWKEKHCSSKLNLHVLTNHDIPKKVAGAGFARRQGMDEAINRFGLINNSDGIIISLDADTVCGSNYLLHTEKFFDTYKNANGCNYYFEHDINNEDLSELNNAICQYELYLRYYTECLRYIGFPFPFHTIGSCFAVKASAYCKQGGMNLKQAGEDFYFLQKIFYLGNFFELNSVVVYPAARISDRVLFGTGPELQNIYQSKDNYAVYNFESFEILKKLFDYLISYYSLPKEALSAINSLPKVYIEFLEFFNYIEKIKEIKENVGDNIQYKKRLFQYFNNLFIVKSLNHLHRSYYEKSPINIAACNFYNNTKDENLKEDNLYMLLEIFREIQRSRPIIF